MPRKDHKRTAWNRDQSKNWLFIGSPAGGKAAAAIFSLIASCQLHGIEPLAYFTDVVTRLPATLISDVDQFLPDTWNASHGRI